MTYIPLILHYPPTHLPIQFCFIPSSPCILVQILNPPCPYILGQREYIKLSKKPGGCTLGYMAAGFCRMLKPTHDNYCPKLLKNNFDHHIIPSPTRRCPTTTTFVGQGGRGRPGRLPRCRPASRARLLLSITNGLPESHAAAARADHASSRRLEEHAVEA
jgi:hypothetical protein